MTAGPVDAMDAMLLIGEKLNSSRSEAKRIFAARDGEALLALARAQIEGGASFVDLNAAMLMDGEEEALRWAGRLLRERLGARVVFDGSDAALLARLAAEFGEGCIVNSLPCDDEPLGASLAALSRAGAGAVVMLKDRAGVPASPGGRVALADLAVRRARESGIPPGRILLDPVVMPAATGGGLLVALETLREVTARHPDYGRIAGLSNVSFGLPERALVNRTFAAMLVASGATALICDTTDRELARTLAAAEAIAGADPGCKRYLSAYRAGRARA